MGSQFTVTTRCWKCKQCVQIFHKIYVCQLHWHEIRTTHLGSNQKSTIACIRNIIQPHIFSIRRSRISHPITSKLTPGESIVQLWIKWIGSRSIAAYSKPLANKVSPAGLSQLLATPIATNMQDLYTWSCMATSRFLGEVWPYSCKLPVRAL